MLRLLERRSGELRSALWLPEEERIEPLVDVCVTLGSEPYAFEHTQIEPFPGQIKTGKRFSDLVGPLERDLAQAFPGPAHYHLAFPLDPSLGVPPGRLPEFRAALAEWVRSVAPGLYGSSRAAVASDSFGNSFHASSRTLLPQWRYPVALTCHVHAVEPQHEFGRFGCVRNFSEDDELKRLRAERLRKALSDKCPKRARCKDEGARTVLVLESDDIALTNHIVVRQALVAPMAERSDLPDEIYLVETEADTWVVSAMNSDADASIDERFGFEQVPKAELVALGRAG